MEDYDEGLGTVYERFMLDNYFESLLRRHNIKNVLEVPIFGMTGVSGINSIYFARHGCDVILVDDNKERIKYIEKVWNEINEKANIVYLESIGKLPFKDSSFELVWNFASLDKVNNPELVIKEMLRVSSKFVLIFVPNNIQFVNIIYRIFSNTKNSIKYSGIKKLCKGSIIDEGFLDIPPWPDTKFSIKSKLGNAKSKKWRWSMVDYLKGDLGIKNKAERYSFIEKSFLPNALKQFFAHHRFLLVRK